MGPREFHIWHFPEEKVRVLFKNHKNFIDNAVNSFGSQKALANFLGISPELLSVWKRNSLYIPLSSVRKIVNRLRLNWIGIEKEILSYKGISTGIPIKNSRLPIKENPEIFELITHIICDGCVNRNGIPSYINSNKDLINNFWSILQESFGNINGKLYPIHKNNKICYEYRFPKVIVELLEHFYDISFYKAKEFPSELLYLPKEFAISTIKAFADDEGSVDLDRRIGIYSTNKKLLKTLIMLLKEKFNFKNITDIKEKEKHYYYFYIKSKDLKKYQKEIGFIHPDKRRKLIEIMNHRANGYRPGQHAKVGKTKEKVLKLLNNKILSTYDIMKEVRINKSNINMHIKSLINEGFIVQHHKEGQNVFWARRN